MPITTRKISIFDLNGVDAIVNFVNTVGVMGAGLAYQFKIKYPYMYEQYRYLCDKGIFDIGDLYIFSLCPSCKPRYIINLPTKRHWSHNSEYTYIRLGLMALKEKAEQLGISSIGVPKIGCGLGELDWKKVHKMIKKQFDDSDIRIVIVDYHPLQNKEKYNNQVDG